MTVRRVVAAVTLSLSIAGCQPNGSAPKKPATHPTSGPAATQAAEPIVGTEDALTDITQLTRGFDRAGEAYFSPDMNWIVFQASEKGEKHYAQYVVPLKKADGKITGAGAPVRISAPNSRNTCGYFSPDGKTLIFASTAGKEKPEDPSAGYQRQGGNYRWDFPEGQEIFRADDWQKEVEAAQQFVGRTLDAVAGTLQKAEAPHSVSSTIKVDLTTRAITNNNAYDAEGAYSPDGQWIVFGSRRDGDSDLYVMRPDGTGVVRLTNQKGYDGGPFFAPDGKRVIYRSDRKGNDLLQVFVADLVFDDAGNITGMKNEKQLTDDANVNWGPYFHPDSRHIVYATSAHGHHNYEVYAMRDDGTHKTRLTYKAGFDGLPVFSPDGRYLMWSSKRSSDNTTQIFVAKFLPPSGW